MAALSGIHGSVVYMTGGTTVVGEIAEWSIDSSMEPPETTAFGDEWAEYIAGIRSYSGSFSGNLDPSNNAQGSAISQFFAGSAVGLRLYHSAAGYFNAGTVLITGMTPSISVSGKGDVEFSFQGSGALTIA